MKLKKFLIIFIVVIQSCSGQKGKVNGISFVSFRGNITDEHIEPIINVNANYAAVIPFGFIRDINNPNVSFNKRDQWYGETKEGVRQYIKKFQNAQIKVMLKPQIWVWQGAYTGYIKMNNEADWKVLENSYTQYVMLYAKLAEEMNVSMFCIGTELEQFIADRPEYWHKLIKELRSVYSGKITYAANWDEYKRTPFWNDLDYIGIDAYFPVSNEKTPTLKECLTGWEGHKNIIKAVSETHDKPILFTEFGYRSIDYSGKEPWNSDRGISQVNLEAQTNTTQALFTAFWDEEWFAGGFIWKWHHDHKATGGKYNSRFTPQNKPVEALLKAQYGKFKK